MEGGKDNIDEIHVSRDEESAMAKEYAGVVEKLQEATKREQQQKVMKQVNEKLIVQTVSVFGPQYLDCIYNQLHNPICISKENPTKRIAW